MKRRDERFSLPAISKSKMYRVISVRGICLHFRRQRQKVSPKGVCDDLEIGLAISSTPIDHQIIALRWIALFLPSRHQVIFSRSGQDEHKYLLKPLFGSHLHCITHIIFHREREQRRVSSHHVSDMVLRMDLSAPLNEDGIMMIVFPSMIFIAFIFNFKQWQFCVPLTHRGHL